ncbi:hypothetical protein LP419_24290 [Massilia sp. H-1]|nr:hypothetical protein LP419_24290 [Massilia sp. H-1]
MAAYGVARELRKRDQEAALTIVSGDSGASYAKPMLSERDRAGQGSGAAGVAQRRTDGRAAERDGADQHPG